VNVGTGSEISIKDLASLIAEIIGYEGKIIWDTTKPNGTPRKLLDLSKMKSSGWKAKTKLKEGIRLTYNRYIRNPETSHHIS
jgi:GDP-L-fucose synthase